jgi:membrane protein DedA with SNARE-associated domain
MQVWDVTHQWLQSALSGMATPWVIGLALVLTSFLLEDVAIAAAASLAATGLLSWSVAFGWVFLGISIGDIGLYATGLGARRIPWLHQKYIAPQRDSSIKLPLEQNLPTAVLLARVIPGLRLVTYVLCGFLRLPFTAFCLWVALAVALWTGALLGLGAVAGAALAQALHVPQPVAVALPILSLALAVPFAKRLFQRRKTKTV